MTRTNKRIKQGNTGKIKNNNNTTVVPEGVIPKYLYTIHDPSLPGYLLWINQ
jgi:hypothetical protein